MHKYRAYTSKSMSFNNALLLIWFNTFCSFKCFKLFSVWAIDALAKGIKRSKGVIKGFNSIIVKAMLWISNAFTSHIFQHMNQSHNDFLPDYARMCESDCPHSIFIRMSLGARLKVETIPCNFPHSTNATKVTQIYPPFVPHFH